MKTILALLLLLAITSCKTENQYIIKGSIEGDYINDWIYLEKFFEGSPDTDSALIKNGRFSFKEIVDYPELYVLHNMSDSDFRHFPFFLEPAKLKIEINLDDWTWGSKIAGGPLNDEFNIEIGTHEKEGIILNRETDEKMAVADSSEQVELKRVNMEFWDQHKQLSLDYISNHPDSPISPYLLSQLFFGIPFDESQVILDSFSDENKKTTIFLSLQDRLDIMKEFNKGSLEME